MRGLGLLRRLLGIARPGGERVTVKVAGIRCAFHVTSEVERFRTSELGGEAEFVKQFAMSLTAGDVVYDVGASVGLFSILAAKTARSVVAVEPDPETCRRLRENLELNACGNVTVVECALGADRSRRLLYTAGVAGFAPSFARQDRVGAPRETLEVTVRTLEDLLVDLDLPSPTVMKIDVEGAEEEVLLGARSCLAGSRGAPPPHSIWLELHPEFLKSLQGSVAAVESLLGECGYEAVWSRTREDQIHRLYRHRLGATER